MQHVAKRYPLAGRMFAGGLASLIVISLASPAASAADRKFLVMLATSPKQEREPCAADSDCEVFLGNEGICRNFECLLPCQSDEDCDDALLNPGPPFQGPYFCNDTVGILQVCGFERENPENVRRRYFVDPDSWAEYWREISYGDVTVSGRTTGWVDLPWRFTPVVGPIIQPLGSGALGAGEVYDNTLPEVDVNLGRNDGYTYAEGGRDTVWMPGERFVDMNEDGEWNGLDEAGNQMDFYDNETGMPVADGLPDNLGPWYDLNENGEADNAAGCVNVIADPTDARVGLGQGVAYLPDSDNDGFPDCCPNGPGTPGCEPWGKPPRADDDDVEFNGHKYRPDACPATTWEGPNGSTFKDCNGNLIPDECDVAPGSALCLATGFVCRPGVCGNSRDELPFQSAGDRCVPSPNGEPDECQYINFYDGRLGTDGCVEELPDPDSGDPCTGQPRCVPVDEDPAGAARDPQTPLDRCEFHDRNGNDELDVVEPFENYIRIEGLLNSDLKQARPGDPEYEAYIRRNYKGDADKVLARGEVRQLFGRHDPLGKLPTGSLCTCRDGQACVAGRCLAGEHAQYDPPDFWEEVASAKMSLGGIVAAPPEPSWYRQAWIDRFGETPPAWDSLGGTPGARRLVLNERVEFDADRGAIRGNGLGWVGCDGAPNVDAVDFATSGTGNFATVCDPHRILTEELLVPPDEVDDPTSDAVRIFYDGPREFIDLPSSKYHSSGDGALGEVTSPFNDNIWGDGYVAGGPYATHVHGNFGYPAGNVLQMELLTMFAGVGAAGDSNLDGRADQGEYYLNGRHSYLVFGSRRLIEDLTAILDETNDFDDFVDPVAKAAVECASGGPLQVHVPFPLSVGGTLGAPVTPSGVLSGVALIPPMLPAPNPDLLRPTFFAVHNEDGLDDPNYPDTDLPRGPRDSSEAPFFEHQISWNLLLHNLVLENDADNRRVTVAHDYLRAWEGMPPLYDPGPGVINCPIGLWDIMAGEPANSSGFPLLLSPVHPIPPLKARQCPQWIDPVDLSAVLTPGVAKVLTLPPYEFVRDESVFFLENDIRPGERYYFWSAGEGFDSRLPGEGLLVVHADEGSNPDAIPPDQRSGDRPTYLIVQGDGAAELQACTTGGNGGDAGDAWPGTSDATEFDFDTEPAATWYTENLWTGLNVSDVEPDGNGSVRLTLSWVPTSIPGLQFLVPPGGTSVRISPTNVRYKVNFRATDVFGGTTIRLYYAKDERRCGGTGALCTTNADCAPTQVCRVNLAVSSSNLIGELRKTTAGTNDLSMDWNIHGIPDGRYVIFAELVPGAGADGDERPNTDPRAGRNNIGDGTLGNIVVNNAQHRARLETWTVVNIDATAGKWLVASSLSQPEPADVTQAPAAFIATTGVTYTSVGGEVQFRITGGTIPFEAGDRFSFTTTGITAVSAAVGIDQGAISEDPRAVIVASPLSGSPPLTVDFDGRGSRDPNGDPLTYRWDFGDGSAAATGATVSHTFTQAGNFTAVLRVTSTQTGRFGEASVDINVVNNSPNAVIRADPTSGPPDLTVAFDATDSSDQETPADQLVYQWNFGDGTSANDAGVPGILTQTNHFYDTRADGTRCTTANPCTFTATLTVTDTGGKTDSAAVKIQVGNTNPVANVVAGPLQGPAPLTVRFNAGSSFDADGDTLTADWTWGDGDTDTNVPVAGPGGDGVVEHTYEAPGTYVPTAVIKDGRGGQATWPGITITVGSPTGETLRALFLITPASPTAGEEIAVDGSISVGDIVSYAWNWGDGSANGSGAQATHTYAQAGSYRITLTVTDDQDNTASSSQVVVVKTSSGEEPGANNPPIANIAVDPPTAEGLVGETFTFDAGASSDPDDDPLTYQWTFGDGSAPVGGGAQFAQVTHAYANPGQYLVRLTVRDPSNAMAEASRAVRILAVGENRRPIPVIATGPRTGTVGMTLVFDGSASYDPDPGDQLNYSWTFQLGGQTIATQTGAVVSQRFDQAGAYAVYLTVTDQNGASTTSEAETVVISVAPEVEPPDGGGPGDGGTGRPEPPDSANQRPTRMCGFGMLPALFVALLSLSAVRSRRRRRA